MLTGMWVRTGIWMRIATWIVELPGVWMGTGIWMRTGIWIDRRSHMDGKVGEGMEVDGVAEAEAVETEEMDLQAGLGEAWK